MTFIDWLFLLYFYLFRITKMNAGEFLFMFALWIIYHAIKLLGNL